jgi:hypothetical protein
MKELQKLKEQSLKIEVIQLELNTKECDAVLRLDEWIYWVTFETQDYSDIVEQYDLNCHYRQHYNEMGEYTHDTPQSVPVLDAMAYGFVLCDAINKGLSMDIVAAEMVNHYLKDNCTVEYGQYIRNKKEAGKHAKKAFEQLNDLIKNHFSL